MRAKLTDRPTEIADLAQQLRVRLARAAASGVGYAYPISDSESEIDVAPSSLALLDDTSNAGESLDEIAAEVINPDCTRCKLHGLGRKSVVFGVGNPNARLMFVGEGPGADEDRKGEPFVGRAGQLLTRMIEAMGLEREDVYITNILMCRPPGNRNPEADEVAECSPYLERKIATIRPKIIVALGKFAAQTLASSKTPISRMRGKWYEYAGTPLMPTFHPAYVLRNPREGRRMVWEDLLKVVEAYNKDLPTGEKRAIPKSSR